MKTTTLAMLASITVTAYPEYIDRDFIEDYRASSGHGLGRRDHSMKSRGRA